jgi:hypothetical protein
MTHRARGTAALDRELFNELAAGPVDADELAATRRKPQRSSLCSLHFLLSA